MGMALFDPVVISRSPSAWYAAIRGLLLAEPFQQFLYSRLWPLFRKRPKFVLCFVRLGRGAADQATSSSAAFARRSAAMRAGVSAAA